MKRILMSLGIVSLAAVGVLIGVSGSSPARNSTALNTPIVDGVHTGQFGANSKVADPKPGPAMINPHLKLTAYDTATGTAVPTSEYVSPADTMPAGTTMVAPSSSGVQAAPVISQQAAVEDAAEQGYPEASNSPTQPEAYYGILNNSVIQTVPLPPGETMGSLNPSVLGQEFQAGEGVLNFQNVPTWVVEWSVPGVPASGGTHPPGYVPPTTAPAPVTYATFYVFVNADTGAIEYA